MAMNNIRISISSIENMAVTVKISAGSSGWRQGISR
jgi:hypothetical protein